MVAEREGGSVEGVSDCDVPCSSNSSSSSSVL